MSCLAARLEAVLPAPAAAAAADARSTMSSSSASGTNRPAIEVRHSVHPEAIVGMKTSDLRRHFLVERVFSPGEVSLTYSHEDRMIVGGAMPAAGEALTLPGGKDIVRQIGQPYFLSQRELGVINIGGPGRVSVDGEAISLGTLESLYVPRGTEDVKFESADPDRPAKFYMLSCPAHDSFSAAKISPRNATKAVSTGSLQTSNARTLYHLIVPGGISSAQLTLGVTFLANGSVWNTMPAHLHDRRSEVYLYFGLSPEDRVIHLMGEPTETRHVIVANEQAVIEPSWSIHSGAGTSAYSFVWGMCGDNKNLTDTEPHPASSLL